MIWVQLLGDPPSKISEGKNMSKIQRNFCNFSILIANIARTDRHKDNRKAHYTLSTTTSSLLSEKIWRLTQVIVTHDDPLKLALLGDYISALKGAPQIFTPATTS